MENKRKRSIKYKGRHIKETKWNRITAFLFPHMFAKHMALY